MADVVATNASPPEPPPRAAGAAPEPLPVADGAATRLDFTTLAEFVANLELQRVDHLDIDLDGLDLNVLKAVPWSRLRPRVVECRFRVDGTLAMAPSWRDAGSYLREQGYTVYLSEWHPTADGQEHDDWRRVVPFDEGLDVRAAARGMVLAFRDDPGWPKVRAAFHRHLERKVERPAPPPPDLSPVMTEASEPGLTDAVQPVVLPPRPRTAYAAFAAGLKRRSPVLYRGLRLFRRAGAHLWRRRRLTIPVAVLLTAWTLAGFAPALAPVSWLVWGTAALAALALTMLYAGLRFLAMRDMVVRLRKATKANQRRLAADRARIARLERALADARQSSRPGA